MAPRFTTAKTKASDLLRLAGIKSPPVPVEDLAGLLKAEVRYEPFQGELSGVRLLKGDIRLIGVNALDPHVRQRFTIAHEIGHLVMHPDDEFHIDETFPIRFRDSRSSTGEDDAEVEANQFAAALLMPETMLFRDVKVLLATPVDDAIQQLAAKYDVSVQAMTIRLTSMGIIR